MVGRSLGLVFLVSLFSISALAQGGKVEPIGALSDPGASDAVKKALEAKGSRVTLADGPLCDIWLRASVSAGNKADTQGAVYTSLPVSAFVGVITFAKNSNDYRGQALKAGTYTLRYALHPADGNHLGISPIRDFLVLVPVSADQNPDAEFKFEDLMKMSMKASGTNHPAVFSLTPPDPGAAAPSIAMDDLNRAIFVSKLKTQSGADMPVAFIIKGRAEQ